MHVTVMTVSAMLLVGVGLGLPAGVHRVVRRLRQRGLLRDERVLAVWGAWYQVYRLPDGENAAEAAEAGRTSFFSTSLCSSKPASNEGTAAKHDGTGQGDATEAGQEGAAEAEAGGRGGLVAAVSAAVLLFFSPETFEAVLLFIKFMVVLAAASPTAEAQAGWLLVVFFVGMVISFVTQPYSNLKLTAGRWACTADGA